MKSQPYYAFYPETAAGSRISLEVMDLDGDNLARTWALDVLSEHASAACVEIWCGDRYVDRVGPDTRPVRRQAGVPTASPLSRSASAPPTAS